MSDVRSINDWMKIFDGIYNHVNLKRTPEQLWIGVSNHCSAIAEGLRSMEFEKILREGAHAFEWMCAFSSRLQSLPPGDVFSFRENLSSMVGMKYPNMCGHCVGNPCACNSVEMDAQEDKPGRYAHLRVEWKRLRTCISEYSLLDWQRVFFKIYRQNTHLLTPEAIGFHFLEEVGEEGHAVRVLSELRGAVKEGLVEEDFASRLSEGDALFTEYLKHEGATSEERAEGISLRKRGPKASKEEKALLLTSTTRDNIERRLAVAKIHVITELADTFAWLCSVLNKVWLIAVQNNAWKVPEEYRNVPLSQKIGVMMASGVEISAIENAIMKEYDKEYDHDGRGLTPVWWCPSCRIEKRCSCTFSFLPEAETAHASEPREEASRSDK